MPTLPEPSPERLRRAGTFDRLTRHNVAALGFTALAVAVAFGCWRAGLAPLAAVAAGALGGACCALAWAHRRPGIRPGGLLALCLGWAILLGPVAWLVVVLAYGAGGD